MDSVDQLFSITILLYYTIIYNLHINYLQWTYFTQIPHAFVWPLQRWLNHVLLSIPFSAIFVEYLAELERFSYLTASLSLINRSCWTLVLKNRGIYNYKRLIEKTMGKEWEIAAYIRRRSCKHLTWEHNKPVLIQIVPNWADTWIHEQKRCYCWPSYSIRLFSR